MAKTILVLAANPKNTPPLRLDQEIREIDDGLQRAQYRDEFVLKQKLAVRSIDVRRAVLDYKPNIVHFCGHGSGEEGIAFEDESGQAKLVGTDALSGFFELFAANLECVVLNACYSEVQAEAIAKHIPYVVGMKRAIGDAAAIEFATAFYDALGAGESFEFAFKLACNAIQWANISEYLTPVLKAKERVGATVEDQPRLDPVKLILARQTTLSSEDSSRVREYLSGPVLLEERWDVIRKLGKPGSTNVIPLLQEIIRESHDYNSRYLATVALGEIGPTAQTALLEALGHTEPSVRWTALQSLSKLPSSPAIISRIREILKNDSEWLVQSNAIDTLGELNAAEAVGDLISLLHSSPVWVRKSVARVLGKFNSSEVKAALRHTVLNDPEQEPRLWAIESLAELKDVDTISILATLRTDDPDEYVRKAAANAYFRTKNWTKGALSIQPIQLRSQMLHELGFDDGIKRVKKGGFFNSDHNKQARGILHQYEMVERQGQKLVIDHTTGLAWQQSGSPNSMVYPDAEKYVDASNSQRFGGYTDWRLPTLDEAMSLMEPEDKNGSLHIASVFEGTQEQIWTADQSRAGGVWRVDFFNGTCEIYDQRCHYYVRMVR